MHSGRSEHSPGFEDAAAGTGGRMYGEEAAGQLRTTESWALRHGGADGGGGTTGGSVGDGGAAARVEFVAATASTVRLRLRLHAVRSGQ